MRLVIARCSVDYIGRLTAHLPMADRLVLVKADGSVSIHADDRAYKPLNWMTPPCTVTEAPLSEDQELQLEHAYQMMFDSEHNRPIRGQGLVERSGPTTSSQCWTVENPKGEKLVITIEKIHHDISYEMGADPGLVKDGVEAHLQELLADNVSVLGEGLELVRREFPTPIGPVDLLCRTATGGTVAVEVKRRGEIDGVEQLTRYVELLNRDSTLAPVGGIFAAQQIKPQARTLAEDRGFRCVVVDYDELRGFEPDVLRLF